MKNGVKDYRYKRKQNLQPSRRIIVKNIFTFFKLFSILITKLLLF